MVWNYWNDLPESEKFDLVVLCPGELLGKLYKAEKLLSITIIRSILQVSKIPLYGYPKIFYQLVDIRDVVAAYKKALEVKDARGQRFLIVGEGLYWV